MCNIEEINSLHTQHSLFYITAVSKNNMHVNFPQDFPLGQELVL